MILNDENGNSLVLDFGEVRDGNIVVEVSIQPQVSESTEITLLGQLSETIKNMMSTMMLVQLFMSTFFSTGFEVFMTLVGS